MCCWRRSAWNLVLPVVTMILGTSVTKAQELALAERGPRFLFAAVPSAAAKPVDIRRTPVLRQQIALDMDGATLAQALAEITRQSGLAFVYSRDVISPENRVHLRADQITVAAALTEILLDAGVDVLLSSGGQAALIKRLPETQNGSVTGRVMDTKTGAAIADATVIIERTSLSASTDNDGRYRIADVAPGTYTVRARYIGYAPGTTMVTVSADSEATADLALTRSAQRLEELVTTGTIVPTEVRALPTPVSVLDETEIAVQRPHTVQEVFRQTVPGAVSWDDPSNPYYTPFSVRGASTLAGEIGQMKVFIDGIETASPSVSTVDPNSIARVEVIRGPQASAIYGSDAVGGVVQIFTKRGDPSLTRPTVEAGGAFGIVQTPYSGFNGVLRQKYDLSVRGGGSGVSYSFGGGYSHTADYLPAGETSAQSSPTVYGGIRFDRGIVNVDVSARYYTQNTPIVANPDLTQTGFFYVTKPFFEPQQFQSQTVGARLTLSPKQWWQHRITLGVDRLVHDAAQSQARLTSASDTLLAVFNQTQSKASIGYNTSVTGRLSSDVTGSVTAGFDHYNLPLSQWSTTGALNTTGTIRLPAPNTVTANRTITNNTGYFAQAQLGWRETLFLTGGIRAEQNTNFGDSLGTPVSPRAGLAYVQQVGSTTLKLRGSWGRSIKPPAPGDKLASASAASVQLANPNLGPERQKGWDAGVDAVLGPDASLSLTYYDQTAEGLIQFVRLPDSIPTFQAQNVGRIRNTGIELEGTLSVGPARLRANYGYSRARVDQLAPTYSGDLRVGDQTLMTPKHTAGAALSVTPLPQTVLSAGITYVGSWTNYDYIAFYSCFGGTGPCQPSFRDYFIEYPGFVKLNVGVSQQITRNVSGFVAVDNLTNNHDFEAANITAVMGRITTIGLLLHY